MHLHFMGIGGSGASGAARIAKYFGFKVSGCDMEDNPVLVKISATGIGCIIGHSPDHVRKIDKLVLSPAVTSLNPDDPEILMAKKLKIPVVTWQEFLGELMNDYFVVSVAGTHGKGTTTALLSLMLVEAGLDPMTQIGSQVREYDGNFRIGKGKYFVNEADEFNNNFFYYHPRLAVITSLEFDHPEFFRNEKEFINSFNKFVKGMEKPSTLIVNADDKLSRKFITNLKERDLKTITFGLKKGDWQAKDIEHKGLASFVVNHKGEEIGKFETKLVGEFNISNILGAIIAAKELGVGDKHIISALNKFSGTGRRFEVLGDFGGVTIIDDYAHHPTAVRKTIEAAKKLFSKRRLIAVFEPHMFTRTKTFLKDFGKSFGRSDLSFIADIFPAREKDTGVVSSGDLAREVKKSGGKVIYSGSLDNTSELLKKELKKGDVLLIMGAGTIYTLPARVVEYLTRRVKNSQTRRVSGW